MNLYVDENINVSFGEKAKELLNKNNDIIYYDEEERGIHKISEQRWKLAQLYEKKTWMQNQINANDDRNFEHFERFEFLLSLNSKSKDIKNVIELGCGPFTNIRLFENFKNLRKITLVDPLLNDYLDHPNCVYKNETLNNVVLNKICSSIENLSDESKYHAVVMINVLEHCYDVNLIFEKIINLLDKDAIFIFSDVYFKDVFSMISNGYDAGHPIRLSEEKLNEFLSKFEPIFDKRYEKLYNQNWRSDIYFIGSKK
jgi:SAM-dependent methyltransferase